MFIKNKLKVAASIAEIAALYASKKDQKTTGRAAQLMDKAHRGRISRPTAVRLCASL